jgi:hypothetical protein
LCALAERVGASIREVNFLIVPIEECIARDAARPEGERVGEATIRAMWQRYLDDLATV